MNTLLSLTCCSMLLTAAPKVETRLDQVGPAQPPGKLVRSPNQTRAVLLLHGFVVRFSEAEVARPAFRPWQMSGSLLVKTLQNEADVFAFGYGQNVSLDAVVQDSGLRHAVAALKNEGYREIVLIGHSAGGLIARQFVEDHPDAGVTRVIQVCSPNGGTPNAKIPLHPSQREFLDSLTLEGRQKALKQRQGKKIPENVEFVCVLGFSEEGADTDGVVPCNCQWTPDLWKQGVPVVPLCITHYHSTRSEKGVDALAKLVRERQPRWKPDRAERLSQELFQRLAGRMGMANP